MKDFLNKIKSHREIIFLVSITIALLFFTYNTGDNHSEKNIAQNSSLPISDSSASSEAGIEVQSDNAIVQSSAEEFSAPKSELPVAGDKHEIVAQDDTAAANADTPKDTPVPNTTVNICTMSISCASILNRIDDFPLEKHSLLPPNGIIFEKTELEFNDGENAFELLKRICRQNKIHMEFSTTPLYNSTYIEGIGNIYEFDCGDLSGWTYKVNGIVPGYSCSEYMLNPGDDIEWLYTCDMGKDI